MSLEAELGLTRWILVVVVVGERMKRTKQILEIITVFSPHILSTYSALSSKDSTSNAGDVGLIPGLGRFPGEGNGYPLQYSCLGNPMDRGAQRATVHGVARVGHV